jgi:DNA-binding XRE family transcriptional regulator
MYSYGHNKGMTPTEAVIVLQRAAMTEAAIAEAVGVRQSTINKIKKGTIRPNWEIGDRLVTLAESVSKRLVQHDMAADTFPRPDVFGPAPESTAQPTTTPDPHPEPRREAA